MVDIVKKLGLSGHDIGDWLVYRPVIVFDDIMCVVRHASEMEENALVDSGALR